MTKFVLTMMDFIHMLHFMGKIRVMDSPEPSAVFAVPGVFPPLELTRLITQR